jgi:hypothetical protein
MSDRFDFEQQIQKCWMITDDISDVTEGILEHDLDKEQIVNTLMGIKQLYELKFNKLWDLFEHPIMDIVRENKMLNEECAALRQQLNEAEGKPSLFGVRTDVDEDGFAVIKANKKGKK